MRPLEGVTVLDFTQAYSGPYCTLNMADYGARVIKVERLGSGDQTREWAPLREDGASGYYALYNRNKEGIAVNMRDKRGAEIIKRLVSKADIVVNNFKVGTLDKLGLGYEELKKIKPDIIFASITGYGQDGPMAHLAAYDNIIEATCGLMDQSGFPERQPVRSGASIGDSYTGLSACFGIMCAYYHKLMTGEGQKIDVAMQDALFAGLEDTILEYYGNDNLLCRQGNSRKHMFSPYDVFKCKDGWVSVAAITDEGFREYCEEAGRKDLLNNPDYATNSLRCKNNDSLTEEMKKDFIDLTFDEIKEKFSCKNFGVAPVIHAGQTIEEQNIIDREMVVKINDHNVGLFSAVGIPIKFEKTPGEIEKSSPLLGEHTALILEEIGYSKEEIDNLERDEVIEINVLCDKI